LKQEGANEAERALREYLESNKTRNDEELQLGRRLDELKRDYKKVQSEIEHCRAKLKSIIEKVSKLRLYRLKEFNELVVGHSNEPNAISNCDDDPEPMEVDTAEDVVDQRKKRFGSDGLDEFLDEPSDISIQSSSESTEEGMEVDDADADNSDENNDGHLITSAIIYPTEKVKEFDLDQLDQQLLMLEQKRGHGRIDLALIIDYREKLVRYNTESNKLKAILEQRDLHRSMYDRLKKQRLHEFMDGFRKISEAVKVIYQLITIQGDASLELVDSLDPFSEGISFGVRPPKKSWKQIGNLSGGEKTLASLALVFGLHNYRPTPIYVMDEIDAALDYRNVTIISHLIKEIMENNNAQFIVISLRNNMFENCDRIVGVFKVNDCTQNFALDNKIQADLNC